MRTARVKDDRCLRREGEYDDDDDDVPHHLTREDRVLMLSMLLRQKRCCPPFSDDVSLNEQAKAKGKPTEMAAMAVQRHNLQPIKLAVRVPWKMVVHT